MTGPWDSHGVTYVTLEVVITYAFPKIVWRGTINEQPAPIRLPWRNGAISSGPVYSNPDICHCQWFMPTFPCVAETVSWDLCQGCDGLAHQLPVMSTIRDAFWQADWAMENEPFYPQSVAQLHPIIISLPYRTIYIYIPLKQNLICSHNYHP